MSSVTRDRTNCCGLEKDPRQHLEVRYKMNKIQKEKTSHFILVRQKQSLEKVIHFPFLRSNYDQLRGWNGYDNEISQAIKSIISGFQRMCSEGIQHRVRPSHSFQGKVTDATSPAPPPPPPTARRGETLHDNVIGK